MEIFRTFEHNGKVLQLSTYESELPVKPSAAGAPGSAPGTGKLEICQLDLSSEKISSGETLTLNAQISGSNIAFIYTELLFHDTALNQYYGPVAREYVRAGQDQEVRGVSHPHWEPSFNLSLMLTPGLRLLTDGVEYAFAFLLPEGYGNPDYRLDGLYVAAGGDIRRRARLTFDSAGEVKKMLAFKEQSGRLVPYDFTMSQDDQFSPFVHILTPPVDKNSDWQVARGLSTPLTFWGQPFHWVTDLPMPGEYLAGLLVQDLDWKLSRHYTSFTLGA